MSAERDVSGDVIWTARGLHHHIEVVHSPARAARPSTARQYIAIDALTSPEVVERVRRRLNAGFGSDTSADTIKAVLHCAADGLT